MRARVAPAVVLLGFSSLGFVAASYTGCSAKGTYAPVPTGEWCAIEYFGRESNGHAKTCAVNYKFTNTHGDAGGTVTKSVDCTNSNKIYNGVWEGEYFNCCEGASKSKQGTEPAWAKDASKTSSWYDACIGAAFPQMIVNYTKLPSNINNLKTTQQWQFIAYTNLLTQQSNGNYSYWSYPASPGHRVCDLGGKKCFPTPPNTAIELPEVARLNEGDGKSFAQLSSFARCPPEKPKTKNEIAVYWIKIVVPCFFGLCCILPAILYHLHVYRIKVRTWTADR
jgi:hypothetical protein